MAGGNWEQNDWWNKPQADSTPAAPVQTAPAQPARSPEQIVREIARDEHAQQTQQYAQWAEKRNADYQAASAAFLADPNLAPYYDLARNEFFSLDQMTKQSRPVGELLDTVKAKVMTWKQMGVQPPTPPKRQNGFTSARTDYDIPLGEQASQGMAHESAEERMKANHKYLHDRRVDLDKRKFRGGEDDLKKLEELRDAQYNNSVTLDR